MDAEESSFPLAWYKNESPQLRESSKLRWRRNHKHTPFFSCPNSEISKHQSLLSAYFSFKHFLSIQKQPKLPGKPTRTHTHTRTPFNFLTKLRNPNIFKAFNLYFSFQTFSENPNIDPRKADIIYLFDKSKLTKPKLQSLSANVNLFSDRAAGKPDTWIKKKMKQ